MTIWNKLKERTKLWVGLLGVLIAGLNAGLGWELNAQELGGLLAPLVTYITARTVMGNSSSTSGSVWTKLRTSTTLWAALIPVIITGISVGLHWNLSGEQIAAYTAIAMTYLVGQTHIDSKIGTSATVTLAETTTGTNAG